MSKKYKTPQEDSSMVSEPLMVYNWIENEEDASALTTIEMIRRGLHYSKFEDVLNKLSFTLTEWSKILHISERTIQRYETENKSFDPVQSEKIVQIARLNTYGVSVFGTSPKFNTWLHSTNIAMGGITPKDLLDSGIGIDLIKDELGRIEHGVLA